MTVDISELVEYASKEVGIIFPKTIKVENNELSFIYAYLGHLPSPFDSYYDQNTQEVHIIIDQDAFPFSSSSLLYKIKLPEEAEKVRLDFRGKSLDHLTSEERIEYFFPKLRPQDEEKEY